MDTLLTVIALALLCLAAWLLYKRYTARYNTEPVVVDDYEEEDEPEVQEVESPTETLDPAPEPKKEA